MKKERILSGSADQTNFAWPVESLTNAAKAIQNSFGLNISCFAESFVKKVLEDRRKATFCRNPSDYIALLLEKKGEGKELLNLLTVSYSEFFRDPVVFAYLEQQILPSIVLEKEKNGQSEIRVWSGGCATGQEAWSLAILLEKLATNNLKKPFYRIFASDLSKKDIAFAQNGVYSKDNLANIRLSHLRDYFSPSGSLFKINQSLRNQVDFSCYDLLDDNTICLPASIYGDFDLVSCCNVLLYYNQETQRYLLNKLSRCLLPGAILMVGDTEDKIVEAAGGFQRLFPCASIFRKN